MTKAKEVGAEGVQIYAVGNEFNPDVYNNQLMNDVDGYIDAEQSAL